MGTEATNISETFKSNETTKQFELTDKFESFAITKGMSEQAIQSARTEIAERFGKFNKEGMDDRRFRNLRGTIEGMINNEIGKAMSALRANSPALQGVPIATENIASSSKISSNTPGITNTPSGENSPVVTGALNATTVLKNAIANQKKRLDGI